MTQPAVAVHHALLERAQTGGRMFDIRERLARGDVIVGDGGWGTLLMARGLATGVPPEIFNLDRLDVIESIASRYVDAGAELITTNTFGGSPLKLAAAGLEGRVDDVNRRAVEAARRAVGSRALVSASIGPSGLLLTPYGDMPPARMLESFREQAAVLIDAGADLVCIETMTDLREAMLAVEAVRAVSPTIPVIATMTFETTRRGFVTVMGASVEAACSGLAAAGADIVGSNCGYGIDTMIEVAKAFRRHSTRPIAIQANAGLPTITDGVAHYPESPADLAARAPALLDAGVQIVGGCCGTTPEHIRALRALVDARRT